MSRILLLGPAREAAGVREDEIDGDTVGDVLHLAVARYGEASINRRLSVFPRPVDGKDRVVS